MLCPFSIFHFSFVICHSHRLNGFSAANDEKWKMENETNPTPPFLNNFFAGRDGI